MAELRFTVFDVERGLCVFVRTPNGYGVMIDCGWSSFFSPTNHILRTEAPTLTTWQGKTLAWLIVTHPHDDHVEDINTVKAKLPPAILSRHKNYEWNAILNPPDGDPSLNATSYYQWQQTYSSPIQTYPDLGISLDTFSLSPNEAAAINSNTQHLLNNSSYVTVLTYQLAGKPSPWKVVIAGDNETDGWEALLKKEDFKEAIAGAHFFVTAHHGHRSGFSQDLFVAMGKPLLNISSERAGDQSVYDYRPYSKGLTVNGENRHHLTTRCDGHITVHMTDKFTYNVWTSK